MLYRSHLFALKSILSLTYSLNLSGPKCCHYSCPPTSILSGPSLWLSLPCTSLISSSEKPIRLMPPPTMQFPQREDYRKDQRPDEQGPLRESHPNHFQPSWQASSSFQQPHLQLGILLHNYIKKPSGQMPARHRRLHGGLSAPRIERSVLRPQPGRW